MRSGFSTLTLAHWIDSLVRVSRRVGQTHFDKIIIPQAMLHLRDHSKHPNHYSCRINLILSIIPCSDHMKAHHELILLKRLPPNEWLDVALFKANLWCLTASFSTISSLLNLFSKFFSSFLRSTCSLSVSHTYLALEESYLPLRAAFPNNPTLGSLAYNETSSKDGTLTLSGVP